MDHVLNFEGTSEISKNKEPVQRAVKTDFNQAAQVEKNHDAEQQQELLQMRGEALIRGSMVTAPVNDKEVYGATDFYEESVREEIRDKAKESINQLTIPGFIFAESAKAYDLKELGDKSRQLNELAKTYIDVSFSKRQKELTMAYRLFDEMDQKKKQLLKETDSKTILRLKEEIIRLKTMALICRAKAFAKDTTALNDEIANIEIAANYEVLYLREKYTAYESLKRSSAKLKENNANKKASKSTKTKETKGAKSKQSNMDGNAELLMDVETKNYIEKSRKTAEDNINRIALMRKRQSGLEVFNSAFNRRRKEAAGEE